MNNLYVDLRKIKFNNFSGLIIVTSLLLALLTLCYVLLHSPYKKIHSQVFQTADNIRRYYRDQPGYWKLDTKSAIDDHLVEPELIRLKEYSVKIGIGVNGDMAMPSNLNFDIVLSHLNKSSCIGLVEANIEREQQLGLQKITVINSEKSTEYTWGDEKHSLPVKKYSARNVCKPTENTIVWNFQ